MNKLIPTDRIENKILLIRGQKVMLDRDLAELYGVPTKVLNQSVKRNLWRFPPDFMFQLSKAEKDELVTNCDRFSALKHSSSLPFAFTEQGIAMLSSVLNSKSAVLINIAIMRIFVKLKHILETNRDIAERLKELERKYKSHDASIQEIFEAIRRILAFEEKPRKQVGFRAGDE